MHIRKWDKVVEQGVVDFQVGRASADNVKVEGGDWEPEAAPDHVGREQVAVIDPEPEVAVAEIEQGAEVPDRKGQQHNVLKQTLNNPTGVKGLVAVNVRGRAKNRQQTTAELKENSRTINSSTRQASQLKLKPQKGTLWR